MVHIWTDGSSKGNPGPGGFGVIILEDNKIVYAYNEQDNNITSNQAELKAILHAFELSQTRYINDICLIHSDSLYAVKICNEWIYTWARNNWINSKKETVENLDLIQSLYKYISKEFFNSQVIKTKAHVGILGNELADALADNDMLRFNSIIRQNNLEIDKNDKI